MDDLRYIDNDSTIHRVGDSSKVGRKKSQMDFQVKLSMSKNKIKSSLAKS